MSRQANVADTAETEPVKKFNVAASVSQPFQDAVRKAAKDAQYTVSTWLAYNVEKALGRNPDVPDKDADSENISISTAVADDVRQAIRSLVAQQDGKSQADFLREVAAQAAGYDLSQEPERLPSGVALAAYKDQIKNKDQVLLDLWEDSPEMLARVLQRRGKTWASIGLKDAQVQAALQAGTLSAESNEAVTAASAAQAAQATSPTPEPTPVTA